MNRKLIDPFKSVALPEVIEEYLDYGVAKCCAFNRRGTLLATGTEDGYIIIWDFETRGVAKVLPGHSVQAAAADVPRPGAASATVTTLAWSRNGRHLLSGSLDKRVMLWDVLEGAAVCEVTLASGVTRVCLSPHSPYKAAVSLISTPPVLLDLDSRQAVPLPSIDFKPGAEKGQQEVVTNMAPGVVLLSRSGGEVLLGQLRGVISIYDAASQQVLDVVKLPAAVKVMSMSLNRQGRLLLVNCSDKVVRLYEVRPRLAAASPLSSEQLKTALANVEAGCVGSLLLPPESCMLQLSPLSFQNAVERNAWRCVTPSGDSEHVVGAVTSKSDHRLYVWSRLYGKLETILEGPRNESTADMAWHPCKSMLVTLSSNGKVYIWSKVYDENWSAFAPDFQELDENQEYVEQEDEFDLNKRQTPAQEAGQAGSQENDVDILTKQVLHVFSSDEEDAREGSAEPLYWLPAEVANVEEGSGPADGQQQQQQQDSKPEGDGEQQGSSDEGSDEAEKPDGVILDRPRDRKRRVRFEDYSELSDHDDDDSPPPPPAAAAAAAAAGAGAARGRGRSRGRRGRPPKYGGIGAAAGRGVQANGGGTAFGAQEPAGAAAGVYVGPGSALNPGPAGQQQQPGQQQQQLWPPGLG